MIALNLPYKSQEDNVITFRDLEQNIMPAIDNVIMSLDIETHLLRDNMQMYMLRTEHDFYIKQCNSQYSALLADFREFVDIVMTKGIITEEDIKEYKDSRKLAASILEK